MKPIPIEEASFHSITTVPAPSEEPQMVQVIDPEFSSVCPKTGLPDFGRVIIRYLPDRMIAELKDLKLYLRSFYGVGIMHEPATDKIARDFCRIVLPAEAMIVIDWGARGGLKTVTGMRYEGGKFYVIDPSMVSAFQNAVNNWTNE